MFYLIISCNTFMIILTDDTTNSTATKAPIQWHISVTIAIAIYTCTNIYLTILITITFSSNIPNSTCRELHKQNKCHNCM